VVHLASVLEVRLANLWLEEVNIFIFTLFQCWKLVQTEYLEQKESLEEQLIFGFYPQVYTSKTIDQKELNLNQSVMVIF